MAGSSLRYQLRIRLMWVRPAVWRRVEVPGHFTTAHLHRVIQKVMGWNASHLHGFRVEETRRAAPRGWTRQPISAFLGAGDVLVYTYDFGDSWEHEILVEEVHPPRFGGERWVPVCLGGQRAGPPDDSGGGHHYMTVVEALGDPSHERHDELVEWLVSIEREGFDPEVFDLAAANAALRRGRWPKPEGRRGKRQAEPPVAVALGEGLGETLEDVLGRYVTAARQYVASWSVPDSRQRENRVAELGAVRIREFGPEGERALLGCLSHGDPGVRFCAALHIADIATTRARAAFEELSTSPGLLGERSRECLQALDGWDDLAANPRLDEDL